MCHIPCHYVRYYVYLSLHSGGYGWQYFRCYLYLCHRIHIMYPYRSITFTSWVCMAHLPQLILFVLVAAMWVHLVRTATFVPHITPVRTICTAATKIFFLILPPLVVCFLWHGQAQGCITWFPAFVPHNFLTEPKGIGENPLPIFTTSSGLFSVALET